MKRRESREDGCRGRGRERIGGRVERTNGEGGWIEKDDGIEGRRIGEARGRSNIIAFAKEVANLPFTVGQRG